MNPEQESLLKKYAEAVLNAPPHLHLTSERDLNLFWNRHIMDAVAILGVIPPIYKGEKIRLLDVGSGNGIPGIVFSIFNPTWTVDMLDSDNKKCGFIDSFCKINTMINAHVLVGRAENFAHTELRGAYNIVIARALSKIRVSIELCAAFVKIGGILIVPHGTSWERDLGNNADSLDILGFDMPDPISYTLDNVEFNAVIFGKIADTPSDYPRAVGVPAKKPL